MKTNDLKKGDRILLRNGWYGTTADNIRGNTRMAKVESYCTETGSVYSHDILFKIDGEDSIAMSYTPGQEKLRTLVEGIFG